MGDHTARLTNVYQAKLAEQAERYDDMVESMKKVASMGLDLTVEERNLLSVAYKNVIGARRASWRVLSSIEQKETERGGDGEINKAALVKAYKGKVEKELDAVCDEILKIIKENLLPHAESPESRVFYFKMCASGAPPPPAPPPPPPPPCGVRGGAAD